MLEVVGGQRQAPAASPAGKDSVPIVGGLQGRSGRVRKISPPPVFEPRTVQPVASLYTDWAIPARQILFYLIFMLRNFFPENRAVF